jgi:hypothetical protein
MRLDGVAALAAAILAPILLVTVYLLVVNLGHWPHGGVLSPTAIVGAVLAGVTPIIFARFHLALRLVLAAAYVIPCAIGVGLYGLAFECSLFQRCLS